MAVMSERDVVFTPFMLRVRATLDPEPPSVPEPALEASRLRSIAQAVDDWVGLRTRAEQLVAEANAMLGGRVPPVDLDDEVGTGRLAFTLHWRHRGWRVLLHPSDRGAWIELEPDGEPADRPTEPASREALEDLVVAMLTVEREARI